MSISSYRHLACVAVLATLLPVSLRAATVEDALKFVPVQRDVEYDRPSAKDIAECTINSEKIGKVSAWIVRGPGGQVLRSFADTNNDKNVDRWSYFLNGIESYRDVDANYDGKADNYRWLGLSGSRWAVDENQDGRIDKWKAISAEEVTAEVLAAIKDKDVERFRRVLITPKELAELGFSRDAVESLGAKARSAPKRFKSLIAKQRIVDSRTEWIHFGATRPGVLPAGSEGASRDIVVYENVSAMTESAGKHGQLPIGTLVRIGQNWRMMDIPTALLEEEQRLAAGYFFQPSLSQDPQAPTDETEGISAEMQALMKRLDGLEAKLAAAAPEDKAKIYDQENSLLRQLASQAGNRQGQAVWIQQLADTLSAGAQSGDYEKGVDKLEELHAELAKQSEESELTGYVRFRMLNAQYSLMLLDPKADFVKAQEKRTTDLQEFIDDYPKSSDAPEAMLQLAIVEEFAGNDEEAVDWYERIIEMRATGLVARKAQGARRRLTGVGKPIALAGKTTRGRKFDLDQLKGKLVVVHYWATWCEPCKDDILKLDKLVSKYGGEFTPVGVNVDSDERDVSDFLSKNRLSWPQLYEKGGLDSRLAVDLGILTVPTMILVDEKGNVVNRNIHITEVEKYLSENL